MVSQKDELITDNLGAVLRKARESKGYTREQIAERAGYGVRHIAAIENGEKNPSVEAFCRLVRAIGVSADIAVWPESYTPEADDDQLVRLIRSCDARDRRAIKAMVETLLFSREAEDKGAT